MLADASFEANVAMVGYAHTFTLFDRAAMVSVLAPMGRLSGEATVKGRTFSLDASGFGDPLFEFDLNLIVPKAIKNIPDLTRYEPSFSLDVILDLAVPCPWGPEVVPVTSPAGLVPSAR